MERRGSAEEFDPPPVIRPSRADRDPTAYVLEAVREDPFASINQLKRLVNAEPSAPVVSWWRVFGILRRHKLSSRRARFLYVRRLRHVR